MRRTKAPKSARWGLEYCSEGGENDRGINGGTEEGVEMVVGEGPAAPIEAKMLFGPPHELTDCSPTRGYGNPWFSV